jgi:hypothetical protein
MELKTGEQLLTLMRGFQVPCVLAAGADLDLFATLNQGPLTAEAAATRLHCDLRGMTILLDALTGLGVLAKHAGRYAVAPALVPYLDDEAPDSVTAMLRHQASCLRRWARLPWVVQSGAPEDPGPSVRGADADHKAFIEAMHVVSNAVADKLVSEINPSGFRCVLDVGGATGTWTVAWLEAEPTARAILFDLPSVIPLAEARMAASDCASRVTLVAGDYHSDPLPSGADLVWISAIIHQNSRDQNRELYRRVAEAMKPDGLVLIRDIVMEEGRSSPVAGALFAVNMLVGTEGGATYTLTEIREDLEQSGFSQVRLVRHDEGMHSVISARLKGRP